MVCVYGIHRKTRQGPSALMSRRAQPQQLKGPLILDGLTGMEVPTSHTYRQIIRQQFNLLGTVRQRWNSD